MIRVGKFIRHKYVKEVFCAKHAYISLVVYDHKACIRVSLYHGVQRRMISVVNFFVFLRLLFLLCCCYM